MLQAVITNFQARQRRSFLKIVKGDGGSELEILVSLINVGLSRSLTEKKTLLNFSLENMFHSERLSLCSRDALS